MQKRTLSPKRKKGFTLIELVVIVAILAVLAAIALPMYVRWAQTARETVDLANVKILNNATAVYAIKQGATPETAFPGLSTDAARMGALVSSQYLDAAPEPEQPGKEFRFNTDAGQWYLGT